MPAPRIHAPLYGFVHPDFARTAVAFHKTIPARGGAALCVYHRGEPVVDLWSGTRNDAGDGWLEDTISLSFSVTKGVTATALHILADRGEIDYAQRVAHYWPEFAQNGKQDISVRQLLSHQAGLWPVADYAANCEMLLDWDAMTDALARAKPEHAPGERHGYHGWTFGWLVGELVRRVSQKPLGEFVASEIVEPLGLDGMFIGAPEVEHGRIASTLKPMKALDVQSYRPVGRQLERVLRAISAPFSLRAFVKAHLPEGLEDFDLDAPAVLSAEIPAVNGLFTARSLAKLYALLGRGGELDGVRLLSAETIAKATEVQSNRRDYVLFGTRMGWRLGYHQAFGLRGGIPSSFGHFGANGAASWADPKHDLAVGFTRNNGMCQRFPYLATVKVSGAAHRCAVERAPQRLVSA